MPITPALYVDYSMGMTDDTLSATRRIDTPITLKLLFKLIPSHSY